MMNVELRFPKHTSSFIIPESRPKNMDAALRNNTAGINIDFGYFFSLNSVIKGIEKYTNEESMQIEIDNQIK